MNRRALFVIFPALCALLLSACTLTVLRGSGNVTTEERQVSAFDRVTMSGIGELTISQGDQEALQIQAEDNILPRIETRVENGTLIIGFKDANLQNSILPTKPIKYFLKVKSLNGLTLSGAGNIQAENLVTDNLDLTSSGAGAINLGNLDAKSLNAMLSGLGNLSSSGQVDTQMVTMSGAGAYDAGKLQSRTTTITISGAGNATVWADEKLNANISGAGSVNYYGDPEVNQSITGLGKVKSLGAP